MKRHAWVGPLSRKIMYYYCGRCGLIRLNNSETQRAVRNSCPGKEDNREL